MPPPRLLLLPPLLLLLLAPPAAPQPPPGSGAAPQEDDLAVLQEFPTLSPSVDTFTSDYGASAVLLNARGTVVISPDLPPVLLIVWLPREYPYVPPLVYAFPAAPSATLVPDHPFVDHQTGRVHRTLPYIEAWSVPHSSLTGLVRSLVAALRMCHPLTTASFFRFAAAGATAGARAMPADEERSRMHAVLLDELAARLGRDAAAFRGIADVDIHAMSSMQAGLRSRGHAMGRAIRDLEEERTWLEHAVTASLAHRGKLLAWLHKTNPPPGPRSISRSPKASGEAGGARMTSAGKQRHNLG